MKIRLPVHAMRKSGYVVLKETNKSGAELFDRIFLKKQDWEERNGREFYLQVELDLRYQKRTFKQNSSVWKLVECIWLSMEKDPPTEEEKYALYLDLLEVYADKTPSRITGGLRSVHISESNSMEGARFIDGLLYHLATMCNLQTETASTVFDVMCQFSFSRNKAQAYDRLPSCFYRRRLVSASAASGVLLSTASFPNPKTFSSILQKLEFPLAPVTACPA
jgi:hypothetical protein